MDVLSSFKSLPMSPGRADVGSRKDLLAPSSTTSQPASQQPKADGRASSQDDSFSKHLRQPPQSEKTQTPQNSQAATDKSNLKSQTPGQQHVQQEIQNKNVNSQNPAKKEEMVDSIQRRVALQTFIRKMKDEVGVNAHDIMQAFGALSSEELALPPEQNMQKILSELDLTGEQEIKAQNLFEDLLKQTASNSLADHLKASGRQLSMEVLSQRELQEKSLKESLNRMNDSFFVQPQAVKKPTAEVKDEATNKEEESSFFAANPLAGLLGAGAAVGTAAATSASQSATNAAPGATAPAAGSTASALTHGSVDGAVSGMEMPQGMTEVAPYEYEQSPALDPSSTPQDLSGEAVVEGQVEGLESLDKLQPQQAQMKKPENFKSLEEQLRGFKLENASAKPVVSKQAQAAYEMLAPKSVAPQMSAPSGQAASSAAAGLGAVMGGLSLMAGDAGEQATDEGAGESSLYGQGFDTQAQGKDLKAAQMPKFELNMQPTAQEESSNIKELINQAQFLSKKGGGEMKVALTPDGLGEVQMKVSVQDGSVNVEMLTESNEAKKLLEKGLGDLKSTLASHKLNVENIKVDFQGEISKHLEDQQRDAERQFQQQFLENFRQENGGFRRSFMDLSSVGGSLGKDKDETEARLQTQSVKPKRSDKRLDLVA